MRGRLLLLGTLLLAGCFSMKLPPVPTNGFSATGRVGVRSGSESNYANFSWQSQPQSDLVSFGNPLGQTLAELEIHYKNGVAEYAMLTDGEGHSQIGEPEQLLLETTGMRLPVGGLRWWLQGKPAPGAASSVTSANDVNIGQDGWQIVATDFAETEPVQRGPRKITLTRDGIAVRIVISEWQWQTSPQP